MRGPFYGRRVRRKAWVAATALSNGRLLRWLMPEACGKSKDGREEDVERPCNGSR